jgi:hypothetical protein
MPRRCFSFNRGSGCLLWFDILVDTRELGEIGQDLYIRMASSELGTISLLFSLWIFLFCSFILTNGADGRF